MSPYGCVLKLINVVILGQFYVMMSPQDVLQTGQRAIAPRTTLSPITLAPNRTIRDERRRTSHNEGCYSILAKC